MTTEETPLPSDDFTPEELAEAGQIRPLDEVPSNWTVKGEPTAAILTPSIDALNPEDRKEVYELAGAGADEGAVNAALMTVLRKKAGEARLLTGAGEGATAVEHVALEHARRDLSLSTEYARIEAELQEVSRYDVSTDFDGNTTALPVLRYEGDARKWREERLDAITRERRAIHGAEGTKEIEEATRVEAAHRRNIKAQAAEAKEIERRAEAMVREDRISARAATRARMLKGGSS